MHHRKEIRNGPPDSPIRQNLVGFYLAKSKKFILIRMGRTAYRFGKVEQRTDSERLRQRLNRNSELKRSCDFMNSCEQLGHMERAQLGSLSSLNYYIPHHHIVKESSSVTKLRVVFEAYCFHRGYWEDVPSNPRTRGVHWFSTDTLANARWERMWF